MQKVPEYIIVFRDGLSSYPRYHPLLNSPLNSPLAHNACLRTALLAIAFAQSAPECSLLFLSLKQRSQSVTPYSCQVSTNRVSFFAFSLLSLKRCSYVSTCFFSLQDIFLLFSKLTAGQSLVIHISDCFLRHFLLISATL